MAGGILFLLRCFRDGDALRRRRALGRLLVVFVGVKLALLALCAALIWRLLASAPGGLFGDAGVVDPQGTISQALSMALVVQLWALVAALSLYGPWGLRLSATAFARTLTQAVEARDTRVAPEITIARTGETTPTDLILGPIERPMRRTLDTNTLHALGALAALALAGAGLALIVSALHSPAIAQRLGDPAYALDIVGFPFILMLAGLGGLIWALVSWRLTRIERQPLLVSLDEAGATFRRVTGAVRPEDARRVRWSEACGFARLLYKDQLGRLHEVFVLSAADEDYLWEVVYARPGAAPAEAQRDEAWRVAAHRLVEVVTARAGLPLLDLAPIISGALTSNDPSMRMLDWNLFGRALAIASAEGDTALADAISQRLGAGVMWTRWAIWTTTARGRRLRRLSPAQRAETLRLARALLPYYPTPAQVNPSAWRRRLLRGYLVSEYALLALLIALGLASPVVFIMLGQ